jgi:wyosine [tRNA(Phe)-imidazoG37] synthetase (radical SAM superfamily)
MPMTERNLTVTDHSRESAGLTYVYPVVSRRSGGLSVGVNLNVNNACNWRCIYCQVPNLTRGGPPPVDLNRLKEELAGFLKDVLEGDFLIRHVPQGSRRLNDIAISGNGEPTSAREFAQVVELIADVRREMRVPGSAKTVLITNGSLVHRKEVQAGLSRLSGLNGRVWFKIDSATGSGMRTVNGARVAVDRVRSNLEIAARACPTWIQTCVFMIDGREPDESERRAYLDFLSAAVSAGIPFKGVLLYGLARPSLQPEAPRLSALSAQWLESHARRIRALDIEVVVTP